MLTLRIIQSNYYRMIETKAEDLHGKITRGEKTLAFIFCVQFKLGIIIVVQFMYVLYCVD